MSREIQLSSCCSKPNIVEPIYLNTKREDGTRGRKTIAEIVACSGCHKTVGDARSLCAPKLAPSQWADLLGVIGKPPFYVNDVGGVILPESMDLLAFDQAKMIQPGRRISISPQDKAANDEPELDYAENY